MRTTTAFFAGVGTVVIAIAAGLGGGMVIANIVSPHQPRPGVDMTKLERRTAEPVATSNAPAEPVPYLAAIQAAATNPVVVNPAPQANTNQAAASPTEPRQQASSSAQPAVNAPSSTQSGTRVSSDDALARARDADIKREARAERRRKAERRQQWAERRRNREPREDELREVERSVREETERPRVLEAEPVSIEMPRIRLFGNED